MDQTMKKKIAEIREWHEGKRNSFPQFTAFEAVGVMLDEIDRLKEERDKLIEGLREIDTHIRSTPEPVQYIVETLKRVLPEYREGMTVDVTGGDER